MRSEKEQENPFVTELPRVSVANNRLDFVLQKCRGRKVLHLGCINVRMLSRKIKENSLTHFMLLKTSKEVWGVDINAEGIKLLKDMGVDRLVHGDVEKIDRIDALKKQTFDVILATEILEHLDNPGLFLSGVKNLLSPHAIMILTVPNATAFSLFAGVFKGREVVHPDHNFWFSYRTLSSFLTRNGYTITEVLTYSYADYKTSLVRRISEKMKKAFVRSHHKRNDTEPEKMGASGWDERLSGRLRSGFGEVIGEFIRRFFYRINPFFADGLIFVVECKNV